MQIRTTTQSAFTLVEIMIVVAIIGLLAAIAIPNFVKARTTAQKNACVNNLRQIDGAKEQWALENRAAEGDTATENGTTGVNSFIKGQARPICPANGSYEYNTIGENPTCSVNGHSLSTNP